MEQKVLELLQETQKQVLALEQQKKALREEVEHERQKLKKEQESTKARLEEEIKEHKKILEQEHKQWTQEKERIENLQLVARRKIKLDVGGHLFSTSLTTLTSQPDSMLAAMFSGRHNIEVLTKQNINSEQTDEEGRFFIDRDGQAFAQILKFLRTNKPLIVKSTEEDDLLEEAKYYGLTISVTREEHSGTNRLTQKDLLKVISRSQVPPPLTGLDMRFLNFETWNCEGWVFISSDLTGANFRKAVLSKAKLSRAVLVGATLSIAKLTGGLLDGANLTGADLSSCVLQYANLTGAILVDANLTFADFTSATLTRANLQGAHLAGARNDSHNWDEQALQTAHCRPNETCNRITK